MFDLASDHSCCKLSAALGICFSTIVVHSVDDASVEPPSVRNAKFLLLRWVNFDEVIQKMKDAFYDDTRERD